MKGIDKLNRRQDLACITIVLEHWVPVLEQMEQIQENLGNLPESLQVLRQQLNELERNSNCSSKISWNKVSDEETINSDPALRVLPHRPKHLEVQTLINNLEGELPRLVFLKEKIHNLIALKEIIEALQERFQNKITNSYDAEFQELKYNLERIKVKEENLRHYNFKKQNLVGINQVNQNKLSKGMFNRSPFKKIRGNSTTENLGIGLTILFGFFLSWSIFNTVTSPNQMNLEVDATTIDADTRWEKLEEEFYWEE